MFKKRITLLDSDEAFCTTVATLLKSSDKLHINKIYHCSVEALKNAKNDFSEIIIMDLDFPELKGTDFIMKVKEKVPGTIILVVTNYSHEEIIFHTITQGASGYLLKKKCLPQLMDSITAMINGGSALDPLVASYIVHSMHKNQASPLTKRESMVLKLLTDGKKYTEIAKDLDIASETVKTHLRNIYEKLDVKTKAQAVRKAIEDRLVIRTFNSVY
jgi:DNA-binding NarL/FixJ family response regulator